VTGPKRALLSLYFLKVNQECRRHVAAAVEESHTRKCEYEGGSEVQISQI
jgi:hypothetical protein